MTSYATELTPEAVDGLTVPGLSNFIIDANSASATLLTKK
jgi:hypothetical protein